MASPDWLAWLPFVGTGIGVQRLEKSEAESSSAEAAGVLTIFLALLRLSFDMVGYKIMSEIMKI